MKHALRNALIAPFTVIMLQFPWLLNGVVIVETLFNYKGFGWLLVQAAGNNDIELLLAVSVVSVFVGYRVIIPETRWDHAPDADQYPTRAGFEETVDKFFILLKDADSESKDACDHHSCKCSEQQ